jgi:2,4-dienoyl-CoA reductase (NADPH2)
MIHIHSNREMLLKMITDNDVSVLTGIFLDRINETGVIVRNFDDNKQEILAETVVLATGLVSSGNLYDGLIEGINELYRIGDCYKPGKIIDAIWQAYGKARLI